MLSHLHWAKKWLTWTSDAYIYTSVYRCMCSLRCGTASIRTQIFNSGECAAVFVVFVYCVRLYNVLENITSSSAICNIVAIRV